MGETTGEGDPEGSPVEKPLQWLQAPQDLWPALPLTSLLTLIRRPEHAPPQSPCTGCPSATHSQMSPHAVPSGLLPASVRPLTATLDLSCPSISQSLVQTDYWPSSEFPNKEVWVGPQLAFLTSV